MNNSQKKRDWVGSQTRNHKSINVPIRQHNEVVGDKKAKPRWHQEVVVKDSNRQPLVSDYILPQSKMQNYMFIVINSKQMKN